MHLYNTNYFKHFEIVSKGLKEKVNTKQETLLIKESQTWLKSIHKK